MHVLDTFPHVITMMRPAVDSSSLSRQGLGLVVPMLPLGVHAIPPQPSGTRQRGAGLVPPHPVGHNMGQGLGMDVGSHPLSSYRLPSKPRSGYTPETCREGDASSQPPSCHPETRDRGNNSCLQHLGFIPLAARGLRAVQSSRNSLPSRELGPACTRHS